MTDAIQMDAVTNAFEAFAYLVGYSEKTINEKPAFVKRPWLKRKCEG